jgi:hypothetical protein
LSRRAYGAPPATRPRARPAPSDLGRLLGVESIPDRRPDPSTLEPPPPLDAVQRALSKTTEYMARELAQPHAVAPDWSEFEWRIARAVVAIHGVAGLMAGRTRWQGPRGWQAFLIEQRAQIALRQPRIQGLLQQVEARARARGVPLVALKGVALHARGIYSPGERPMADLDLLVAEGHTAQATELITELGFRLDYVTWKHRAFDPIDAAQRPAHFGEHGDNPIKIELHSCIREALPLRLVDITALIWPPAAVPGINDYPSYSSLLLHILQHAAGALALRGVRLLHLQDIARLTQGMREADWDKFFRQAADSSLWWAYPPLLLTDRYFDCVPTAVLGRLASACHWQLRRAYRGRLLSDVSLSHLWISAFPGIEWSRSLRDTLAYVIARVRPRPETLALRETFAEVQPLLSGGDWAHTSQGRRIVRWLLARQPRQESLHPVRASLTRPLS